MTSNEEISQRWKGWDRMQKIVMVILLVSILAACATSNVENEEDERDHVEGEVNTLVHANNQLAFDLLAEISNDTADNVFLSPASLYIALSLVYNGADGETKSEMDELLGFKEVNQLNQSNQSFYQQLMNEKSGITLQIANSIWLNDEFQFQRDFQDSMNEFYEAEISEVDIADPSTTDLINNWVKENTEGRIEEIVEGPLDPEIVTFLINAIYLDAAWQHAFDSNSTHTSEFHLLDNSTKEVEMMMQVEQFDYLEQSDFQGIVLPYGDGQMSMQIFLPKEGIDDFDEKFTLEKWESWQHDFQKEDVQVMLPAFEVEFEATLKEALEDLGMTDAFNEHANFSKLVKETDEVYISEIKQKTFLLVDEEGTEAAGATSVEMSTTSMPGNGPSVMEINRPFFLVIIDEQTDAILFTGKITEPPARSK